MRTIRRTTLVAGTLGAVLVLAGSVMAAPTVAITSPAAGTVIDRSETPTFTVDGTASFDAPTSATRTFYLRRDDCGGDNDHEHMRVTPGGDGGDGCGTVPGPVANPAATNFPAEDGLPFTLDATQTAKGTIVVSSFQGLEGSPGFGVGSVTMTVTLTGRVDDSNVVLGTDTTTYTVTPGTPTYTQPFEMELPSDKDGGTVTALNMAVRFTGPAVLHNFIALNGQSFVDVPFMDTGSVLVGIGSLTAQPSIFVPATVSEDGTFSAQVNTPTSGQKRIFARAVQWGPPVPATPDHISVVA